MKRRDRASFYRDLAAGRRLRDVPHRAVYARRKGGGYDLLCCDDEGVAVGGWIVHRRALEGA